MRIAPNLVDRTGLQYGQWKVLRRGRSEETSFGRTLFWVCVCSCGAEHEVQAGNLSNGKSTRCRKCSTARGNRTTHGETKGDKVSTEYVVWHNMKRRCLDPSNERYADYGGRGITVCDRWMEFSNFLADMGRRPEGKSLNRIDNDKNYCKENCEWATNLVQANNARSNIVIEMNGQKHTIAEWCRILNRNRQTVYVRIFKGWDAVRALITPNRIGKYGKLSKRIY